MGSLCLCITKQKRAKLVETEPTEINFDFDFLAHPVLDFFETLWIWFYILGTNCIWFCFEDIWIKDVKKLSKLSKKSEVSKVSKVSKVTKVTKLTKLTKVTKVTIVTKVFHVEYFCCMDWQTHRQTDQQTNWNLWFGDYDVTNCSYEVTS